jgi:hypothetical protein
MRYANCSIRKQLFVGNSSGGKLGFDSRMLLLL